MTTPLIGADRTREHLQQLAMLHREATLRAAAPPLVDEADWRGPAYWAYRMRADAVAADLARAADELAAAVALAREELFGALG